MTKNNSVSNSAVGVSSIAAKQRLANMQRRSRIETPAYSTPEALRRYATFRRIEDSPTRTRILGIYILETPEQVQAVVGTPDNRENCLLAIVKTRISDRPQGWQDKIKRYMQRALYAGPCVRELSQVGQIDIYNDMMVLGSEKIQLTGWEALYQYKSPTVWDASARNTKKHALPLNTGAHNMVVMRFQPAKTIQRFTILRYKKPLPPGETRWDGEGTKTSAPLLAQCEVGGKPVWIYMGNDPDQVKPWRQNNPFQDDLPMDTVRWGDEDVVNHVTARDINKGFFPLAQTGISRAEFDSLPDQLKKQIQHFLTEDQLIDGVDACWFLVMLGIEHPGQIPNPDSEYLGLYQSIENHITMDWLLHRVNEHFLRDPTEGNRPCDHGEEPAVGGSNASHMYKSNNSAHGEPGHRCGPSCGHGHAEACNDSI